MAIDFPMSPPPANGQIFTAPGGTVWSWNGTAWVVGAGSSGAYLPLVGGTLSGPLHIATVGDTGSSTASAGFTQNRWRFAVNSGDQNDAGTIDYRGYDTSALCIVGAGTTGSNRLVHMWDNVTVDNYLQVKGYANVGANGQTGHVRVYNSNAASLLDLFDDGNSHVESSTQLWINQNTGATTSFGSGPVYFRNSWNVLNDTNSLIFRFDGTNKYWYDNNNGTLYVSQAIYAYGNIGSGGGVSASGEVYSSHSLATGGYVWVNGPQWVNNGGKMYTYSTLEAGGDVIADGRLYCGGGGGPNWYNNGGYMWTDNTIRGFGILPRYDNNSSCGLGGTAWSQVASYWFNTVSDGFLKQHVRTPKADALDKVLKLLPIEYHWTEGETEDMPHHRGFLAQDVRDVMGPDFAGWREENGVQGLSYDELTAVLWQAVQELAAEVAELKRRK